MAEKIPPTEEKEEYVAEIPVDEKVFERLDEFLSKVPNGEKGKELLGEVITDSKEKAFEYAEEMLDLLLNKEIVSKLEPEEEKKLRHNVTSSFNAVGIALNGPGATFKWPLALEFKPGASDEEQWKIKRKMQSLIRSVALNYAFNLAEDYRQMMAGKKVSRAGALNQLKLLDVVSADYIENNILRKIDALPEPIRENLLKVNL